MGWRATNTSVCAPCVAGLSVRRRSSIVVMVPRGPLEPAVRNELYGSDWRRSVSGSAFVPDSRQWGHLQRLRTATPVTLRAGRVPVRLPDLAGPSRRGPALERVRLRAATWAGPATRPNLGGARLRAATWAGSAARPNLGGPGCAPRLG